MSPTQFAAALRDFAAATLLTSPDVSALAQLIAQAVTGELAPTTAPTTALDSTLDEEAFPPLDPIVATVAGTDYTAADLLRLAREWHEDGEKAFDALPAEEQSLHAQLALLHLRQEQPVDHQPV